MFAVIKTGGKQYTVTVGTELYVEKLDVAEGEVVTFETVLALGSKIGTPTVKGASVTAKVEKHGKQRKIVVRKFKKKKGYNVKQGHRQAYTKIVVEALNSGK